jgi:hypothetical protein
MYIIKLLYPKDMVYKIHTAGENIDAEFGQPLNFTRFFKGQYGGALTIAEECLKLFDIGQVVIKEDDKPVFVAVKHHKDISRIEIPRCHRCGVALVDIDFVKVGPIDNRVTMCEVCADDMGI